MDASFTITMGSLLTFLGFAGQVAITIGAVVYSHGQLNQRVRSVEEKLKEHALLSTAVTRLETEMESVGRELKGLRDDFRRVLDEITRVRVRG